MHAIHCDAESGQIVITLGDVFQATAKIPAGTNVLVANRTSAACPRVKNQKAVELGQVDLVDEAEIVIRGVGQTRSYVTANWPRLPPGRYRVIMTYPRNPEAGNFVNITYVNAAQQADPADRASRGH